MRIAPHSFQGWRKRYKSAFYKLKKKIKIHDNEGRPKTQDMLSKI